MYLYRVESGEMTCPSLTYDGLFWIQQKFELPNKMASAREFYLNMLSSNESGRKEWQPDLQQDLRRFGNATRTRGQQSGRDQHPIIDQFRHLEKLAQPNSFRDSAPANTGQN